MRERALREAAQKREEALARFRAKTEQTNLKCEQSYMQAELKRRQIEANAANEIEKQQIEATMKMQIAHIEAMERKEAEAQIEKEKEKQFLATEIKAKAELEIQLANECQEK